MVRMARLSILRRLLGCGLLLASGTVLSMPAGGIPQQSSPSEELLTLPGELGNRGGRLVVSLRAEPKTLNPLTDRKSTRLNSSHVRISYAVFCLKKKKKKVKE